MDCNNWETNILCIVDGSSNLYVHTRNLIADLKFNQRLTVQTNYPNPPERLSIPERRHRIAAAHNQARELIAHNDGYIFSVEDDTVIEQHALRRLTEIAIKHRAFGMAEGVELGRWGIPYVGAWKANDIYDLKQLISLENQPRATGEQEIDAGGLYCSLIKTELYKQHTFTSENGLGPDINFGIELRQLGYQNYIAWDVRCQHYNNVLGKEVVINAGDKSKIITLTKEKNNKWRSSY